MLSQLINGVRPSIEQATVAFAIHTAWAMGMPDIQIGLKQPLGQITQELVGQIVAPRRERLLSLSSKCGHNCDPLRTALLATLEDIHIPIFVATLTQV